MILFFSGSASKDHLPERVLADKNPGVMLTYYEVFSKKGETVRRLTSHVDRCLQKKTKERIKDEG